MSASTPRHPMSSPFADYSFDDLIDDCIDCELILPFYTSFMITYVMKQIYAPLPPGLESGKSLSIPTRRDKFHFERFPHSTLAGELHSYRNVKFEKSIKI